MALWIWPALVVWLIIAAMLPSAGARLLAVWFGLAMLLVTIGLQLVRRSISVTTSVPARLVHGEATEFVVTISNRGRLPAPRVRVDARIPSGGFEPAVSVVEVALRGRSSQQVRIPVTAHSRGRWQPEASDGVVSDPWGIHELRIRGERPAPSIVLPAVAPVRRTTLPAVAPLAEVPDRHSLLHDPTAIVGVRPYQPGDPLRSIHWPATAAAGTLVRRETERAWARDLVVVLDLSESGWSGGERRPAETAISVAASLLVDAVLGHRQPAGLVVTAPRATTHEAPAAASFRVGSSRAHLDAMLVHLATARLQPNAAPLAELLRRHTSLQQPGTTVAVIANHLDEHTAAALRQLRTSGASAVVLQVANAYVFERALDEPPTGGAPRIEVAADTALARLRL